MRFTFAFSCILTALALPENVFGGGNIAITGHDDDYHAAGCRSASSASAQINALIAFARSGAPNRSLPVLSFDHGTTLTNCLGALRIPFTNIDPDVGVPAANNFDVKKYSAMVVASDSSCGGCDNTSTSIDNLQAASAAIGAFLNSGGGIVAFAAAQAANKYYGFLPASASGFGTPPSVGYTATSFGDALGIPAVNGNETHNFFRAPGTGGVSGLYKVVEVLSADGTAETLACANCTTSGLAAGVPLPAIQIVSPEDLGAATVGQPFSAPLSAEGGSAPYSWSAQNWPPELGLNLNPTTGLITGTPNRPGTFSLPVQLSDRSGSALVNRVFTITVAPQPITPYLIEPKQATVGVPGRLVIGLRSSAKIPPDPSRDVRATITANIEGHDVDLRDDGQGGDELAGDGHYTATVTFRNSGSAPVILRALIEGANRMVEEHVEVYGMYSYRGGPAELNLGSLNENSRSCRLWLPDAEQDGSVPMRLKLLSKLPSGHRLEMQVSGKTLKTDEGQILLSPGERMEVCLVTTTRAGSSEARGEPWLRLSIGASRPQTIDVRLRWHVDGLPFWRRWLWLFELIFILAALIFVVYGYVKPKRFPRALAITFVPEYDELDQTPQPLSQWRGVRIGFYRDAHASLQPSYRVTGHTRGALAVLKATADGVWVKPGDGMTLFREVDSTEWREVALEGHAGRRGLVYRIGEKGPYFRLASRV